MRRWGAFATLAVLAGLACAGSPGEVAGRVLGPGRKPVKDVPVVVRVKAWPDGSLRVTDHDGRTDERGRFALPGVLPPGSRYGVWMAAVAPGWTLASAYVESSTPDPMPPAELTTAPARPLRLRFLDDAGKPAKGVAAYPAMRAAADGVRHVVATGHRDAIVARSGPDGMVPMPYFLADDWASVGVSYDGRRWGTRSLRVPSAKDAVVDVPREPPLTPDWDLRAGGDAAKRFFLMGPKAGDREPEAGYGLVLLLPGGDGSAEFRAWVRDRYDEWVDAGWLWAELVAPRWSDSQRIVWPVAGSEVEGMRFTTEEFVAAVVEEAAKNAKIDRRRVLAVGWSSSGPALYRIASLETTPVRGFLIAMSVFHPEETESLTHTKGRPFFLLHSPQDATCPLRLAEEARDALVKSGAMVEWVTYEGGHGWVGGAEDLARRGLHWLADAAR